MTFFVICITNVIIQDPRGFIFERQYSIENNVQKGDLAIEKLKIVHIYQFFLHSSNWQLVNKILKYNPYHFHIFLIAKILPYEFDQIVKRFSRLRLRSHQIFLTSLHFI